MLNNANGHALLLASVCLLASCGSDSTLSPSFVGRSWSLQIGGPQETEPAEGPGTLITFGGVERIRVGDASGRRGENQGCCDEWPLVVEDQTSFMLPPPPQTLEELQEGGLRVAAATYCAFRNEAGMPREEDVQAVNRAVSGLLSVLQAPLRGTTPTEGELFDLSRTAAETLLKDVLGELNIPESEDAVLDAQGNQGLWFIGELKSIRDQDFLSYSTMIALINLLPSLVWVQGDAATRKTLSACGSVLYVDAPGDLLRNDLAQLEFRCGEVQNSRTRICLPEFRQNPRPVVRLSGPELRGVPPASWSIEPTVRFNRLP